MELAAHWHRCQNLPQKTSEYFTTVLYKERDDPVKDGLAKLGFDPALGISSLSLALSYALDTMQNALTQEGKTGFAIHHSLDEFDPGDLFLHLPIVDSQGESSLNCIFISLNPVGETHELGKLANEESDTAVRELLSPAF